DKTKTPYVLGNLVYQHVFRPTVFVLLRSPKTQPPSGRLPTLRLQIFLAYSSTSFGFLMHVGGRDARVPVRAASRLLSATPTGDGLEYQHDSHSTSSGASPRR
ncbi:MAG: hypothetical protein LBQ66_13185, partial [Planctomycetaceae bacterium]|nr:hypothetical protein [Planctomycetaceae bacterium]